VIAPHETRAELTRVLRLLRTKRQSLPPDPPELIGSPRMAKLLDLLYRHFDYIIIDGAPPVMRLKRKFSCEERSDRLQTSDRPGSGKDAFNSGWRRSCLSRLHGGTRSRSLYCWRHF